MRILKCDKCKKEVDDLFLNDLIGFRSELCSPCQDELNMLWEKARVSVLSDFFGSYYWKATAASEKGLPNDTKFKEDVILNQEYKYTGKPFVLFGAMNNWVAGCYRPHWRPHWML